MKNRNPLSDHHDPALVHGTDGKVEVAPEPQQTPVGSRVSQGPLPSGNLRGDGQGIRVDGHTGKRGRTVGEEGEDGAAGAP